MALHPKFPQSPHAVLDPGVRWLPADEILRETSMEKLMPPLVDKLRKKVKAWIMKGRRIRAGASLPLERLVRCFWHI